jgi:hypothetical protein
MVSDFRPPSERFVECGDSHINPQSTAMMDWKIIQELGFQQSSDRGK